MGWLGVDLDQTLAEYEDGMAAAGVIGPPIPKMVERVKKYLDEGWEVRIFTARVNQYAGWDHERQRKLVEKWTKKVFGVTLKVTNVKDFEMICLFDDRAIAVEPGTGRLLSPPPVLRKRP